MLKRIIQGAASAALILLGVHLHAASTADVIFVVDESGSMSGEHAWIGSMVTALDTQLNGAGVTGNQFALVGFGASSAHGVDGHGHTVGSGSWGTAAQLSAATSGLVTSGSTEDGWQAINYALANYTFRANAAVNVILITDENRDIRDNTLNYAGMLSALQGKGALLNAVVSGSDNITMKDNAGANALGHSGDNRAFVADGSGGYIASTPKGTVTGDANVIANYYNLALASGGATWDLQQLRSGGNTALSFTKAFVDIKVQEIVEQATPDGGSALLLLSIGMIGVVAVRRRIA